MKKEQQDQSLVQVQEREADPLTVEELEARVAPSVAIDKKVPTPPPYAPGTLYGLVRRDSLRY